MKKNGIKLKSLVSKKELNNSLKEMVDDPIYKDAEKLGIKIDIDGFVEGFYNNIQITRSNNA